MIFVAEELHGQGHSWAVLPPALLATLGADLVCRQLIGQVPALGASR